MIFTDKQKKLIESVAVACVKVIEPDKLLITDNFMNKTRKNLLKNKNVAIAIWTKDEKEGYQIKGTADYLTDGPYKKMVDEMEKNKGMAHKAAVLVTVNEIWDIGEPKLTYKR